MKRKVSLALAVFCLIGTICCAMTAGATTSGMSGENDERDERDERVIALDDYAKAHSVPRKDPQPAGQDIIDAVAANSVKYGDRSGFNKVPDDPAGKATRLAAVLVPAVNGNVFLYKTLNENCFIRYDADKNAGYVHVDIGDSMYLKFFANEEGETWFEYDGSVVGVGQAIHVGDDHYVAFIPVNFGHVITVNFYLDTPWARIELPVDGTPYLYQVQLVPGVKNDYNVVFHNSLTDKIVSSAYESGIRRQAEFYGAGGLLDLPVAPKMPLKYYLTLSPAA